MPAPGVAAPDPAEPGPERSQAAERVYAGAPVLVDPAALPRHTPHEPSPLPGPAPSAPLTAAARGGTGWIIATGALVVAGIATLVGATLAQEGLWPWRQPGEPRAEADATANAAAVPGGLAAASADPAAPAPAAGQAVPATSPAPGAPSLPTAAIDGRLFELERRMARLNAESDLAEGQAARAEALLVALAARRAVDRGLPLGYLADQLAVRFGDAQPNAVRSITAMAAAPVTDEDLRTLLEAATPALLSHPAATGPIDRLRLQLGALVQRRDARGRAQTAAARIEQAQAHLDAGRVAMAIDAVTAIPGAELVAPDFFAGARRLAEARRALDLIESAAILSPRGTAPVAGLPAPPPPAAPPSTPPTRPQLGR